MPSLDQARTTTDSRGSNSLFQLFAYDISKRIMTTTTLYWTRTSALNMTLPAAAAQAPIAIDRCLSRALKLGSKPTTRRCCWRSTGQTGGQTDTRPLHRPCRTCTTYYEPTVAYGWLGSRVVSVPDSGAEWLGFKSQPRRCRVTVLGKLFTPIVPLFNKQQKW